MKTRLIKLNEKHYIIVDDSDLRLVSGKFRGVFIAQNSHASNKYVIWQYAKLPTPKIDFSQFKSGDVVEVEQKEGVYFYGEIRLINKNSIKITASKVSEMVTILNLEEIKSIIKIK